MIFYFRFAANKNTPAGPTFGFSFFLFFLHRRQIRSSSAANTTVNLELGQILGSVQHWSGCQPYWLSVSLPVRIVAAGGQGTALRQQRYRLCFQAASFFFFFVSKCEKEDGPLIILLIFGLAKAALGLRRLANQPRRIHQTQSSPFCECKCEKTPMPKSQRCFSRRCFRTH